MFDTLLACRLMRNAHLLSLITRRTILKAGESVAPRRQAEAYRTQIT